MRLLGLETHRPTEVYSELGLDCFAVVAKKKMSSVLCGPSIFKHGSIVNIKVTNQRSRNLGQELCHFSEDKRCAHAQISVLGCLI